MSGADKDYIPIMGISSLSVPDIPKKVNMETRSFGKSE
jgi:hypothetical protein